MNLLVHFTLSRLHASHTKFEYGPQQGSRGDTLKWERGFLENCKLQSSSEVRNLPGLLQQTLRFLSSFPKEFREEYMRSKLFERLLREDYRTGVIVYWQEIDERIKFLWHSTSLKALSLLEDIANCINSKNYFPALISTRALLENVAVLHFYFDKIKIVNAKVVKADIIGKIVRKEINGMAVSEELEDLLIKYSHGTTLKDLLKIREKWKQTRISKYIKFLSKEKQYRKTSDYYSFLCQVAHPNFGSTWVFYYGGGFDNGREIHHFGTKQNLDFFLLLASYPLNISCKILIDEIPKLQGIKFV